jgi:hypothetical protein
MTQLQNLLNHREGAAVAARRRYREILRAFVRGDEVEPEDTDAVLRLLGITIDRFAGDIVRMKERLAHAQLVADGRQASEQRRQIDAKYQQLRGEFRQIEEGYRERLNELKFEKVKNTHIHEEGRKAEHKLRETADPALIDKEHKAQTRLEQLRIDRNAAEEKLKRARAIPPKGRLLPSGDASPGRNPELESQIEDEIKALEERIRDTQAESDALIQEMIEA